MTFFVIFFQKFSKFESANPIFGGYRVLSGVLNLPTNVTAQILVVFEI